MTKHNTLRKAAILISSLDARSADALLDEMAPEDAARVRNAVMELGDVDPQEQQQIMRDFVRHTPQRPQPKGPAVELDPSLAAKLRTPTTSVPADPVREPIEWSEVPFSFLDRVDAEELAQALVREHPQTTAIIIAHLPPSRAADVLRRLPSSLQSVALLRIAHLETPSRDVVSDVEREMQTLLQNRRQVDPVVAQGVATIRAILDATSVTERQELLAELSRQDTHLARHFGEATAVAATRSSAETATREPLPTNAGTSGTQFDLWSSDDQGAVVEEPSERSPSRTLTFADLEKLDDAALAHVLHVSSPHTALLALAGASHDFVQRILQQLPVRDAGVLQRKMQQLGPIRLDDVEFAQLRLADVAQQLIENGEIAMPAIERFAVAA
ncbi:MAG: FliG C-terminal domain-containing protein [Pirellulaceae bacterium]